MFKIGEFSKLTQVSVRMLRYYDEMNLLKPEKVDSLTNYRWYRAEQIPRLNQIIFLRDLGFTVAEIQEALINWQEKYLEQLLTQRQQLINQQIEQEQLKLKKIELAKKDLVTKKIAIHCNVSQKAVPSYLVLSLRRTVKDYFQEGFLWKELAAFVEAQQVPVTEKTLTIYHGEEYQEQNVDIEICTVLAKPLKQAVPLPFMTREIAAVPYMASSLVYGSFENINDGYLAMAAWLAGHNQYQLGDHSRQIVHRGPWNETEPQNFLTEIQIPLEKK